MQAGLITIIMVVATIVVISVIFLCLSLLDLMPFIKKKDSAIKLRAQKWGKQDYLEYGGAPKLFDYFKGLILGEDKIYGTENSIFTIDCKIPNVGIVKIGPVAPEDLNRTVSIVGGDNIHYCKVDLHGKKSPNWNHNIINPYQDFDNRIYDEGDARAERMITHAAGVKDLTTKPNSPPRNTKDISNYLQERGL